MTNCPILAQMKSFAGGKWSSVKTIDFCVGVDLLLCLYLSKVAILNDLWSAAFNSHSTHCSNFKFRTASQGEGGLSFTTVLPSYAVCPPCLAASKRHLPPISLTFVFSEEICSATSLHARLKQVFHYYTRPLLLKNRQDDQMNPSQFSSFSFVIFCIRKIIGKCLKLILLPLRNKLSQGFYRQK